MNKQDFLSAQGPICIGPPEDLALAGLQILYCCLCECNVQFTNTLAPELLIVTESNSITSAHFSLPQFLSLQPSTCFC